jgi:hypothetical protein
MTLAPCCVQILILSHIYLFIYFWQDLEFFLHVYPLGLLEFFNGVQTEILKTT